MSSARRLIYRTWSSPGTYLTEICAATNPYFPACTGKPILSNILENLGGESTPWFMLEPVKHARVAWAETHRAMTTRWASHEPKGFRT